MKLSSYLFGILAPAILIVPLRAEPALSARVSATDLTLNSQITLSVEISGISNLNGSPALAIPNFDVQPAGQMSSTQWVNGQTSSLVTFNYVLTPTKLGTLQIPPLTLNINGKAYSTQPITINVRPDNSQPNVPQQAMPNQKNSIQAPAEGLKPVFMTASVDSEKIYVGQQIILRVQFLKRSDVQFASQARYSEPQTTGFLVEPLDRQEYATSINGIRYDVTELPYALFPTSEGEFTIGPAKIDIAVRSEPDPFDPNSFFQSFFGRSNVMQLTTKSLPIKVRALPANKPANFSGAVGRFKMTAKVDTEQPEVGKPFNLILTVEGVGNVKTIKEPTLPEMRSFRRYETISSSKVSKEGKIIHGSKEFKILLIPQVSGQLTIPPATFVYFNPSQNEYSVETTPEISLRVKPGALNQADQEAGTPASAPATSSEGVRVVEKDIRFIKSGKVRPISVPFFKRPGFLILNLLPPLFALVAFLTRRNSQLRIERASEFRSKEAVKQAKKSLAKARKGIKTLDAAGFYGAVYESVAGYLADKFSISASGLVWETVDQKLTQKKVEPGLLLEIRDIFDQADMARFATSSFSDEAREVALGRAERIILKLEDVL